MDLDHARYVSITTRKRNGDTVSSAVWIAPLGNGRFGFTTEAASGKVKRIRNFPDVELRPCDARGHVPAGATALLATARVVTGDSFLEIRSAIKKKYRWQFTMVEAFGTVKGWFGRGATADCGVALQIQP